MSCLLAHVVHHELQRTGYLHVDALDYDPKHDTEIGKASLSRTRQWCMYLYMYVCMYVRTHVCISKEGLGQHFSICKGKLEGARESGLSLAFFMEHVRGCQPNGVRQICK